MLTAGPTPGRRRRLCLFCGLERGWRAPASGQRDPGRLCPLTGLEKVTASETRGAAHVAEDAAVWGYRRVRRRTRFPVERLGDARRLLTSKLAGFLQNADLLAPAPMPGRAPARSRQRPGRGFPCRQFLCGVRVK